MSSELPRPVDPGPERSAPEVSVPRRCGIGLLAVLVLAGCAQRTSLEDVQDTLVAEVRALDARQDTLLREIRELRATVLDTLAAGHQASLTRQGEIRRRLSDLDQRVAQLSALVGENHRALSSVRQELARVRASASSAGREAGGDTTRAGREGRPAGEDTARTGSAAELYQAALEQFRRGSYETARTALQEFLSQNPGHELAPDAQFYVAESHAEAGELERALEAYARVLELYPGSRRAPTALYKSGRIELERGNTGDARVFFSRVVQGYPDSPEASLARDRLQSLEGGGG